MSKVNVKVFLKNNDIESLEEYPAIRIDNKIIYKDNDYTVSVDYNSDLTMVRENSEYSITLNFKINQYTKGICLLKKENKNILFDVITQDIDIKENIIIVKYIVLDTNQNVTYKLEV